MFLVDFTRSRVQVFKFKAKSIIYKLSKRGQHKSSQIKLKEKKKNREKKQTVRKDVVFFPIGNNASLEVYWKIFGLGSGPAVMLLVLDKNVLRFDCYGNGAGHAHFNLILPGSNWQKNWGACLLLPEKTVEAQIERALFEISKNYRYWLARHPNPAVRNAELNIKDLNVAVTKAREKLIEYHNKCLVFSSSK